MLEALLLVSGTMKGGAWILDDLRAVVPALNCCSPYLFLTVKAKVVS